LTVSLLLVGAFALFEYADRARLSKEIATSRAKVDSLESSRGALQAEVGRVSSELTRLNAERARPAKFAVAGFRWGAECTASHGCDVAGTFRNTGGPGSGVALFSLYRNAEDRDAEKNALGGCSVAIPHTPADATVDVNCTARGLALSNWAGQLVAAVKTD
jgi:hypothetical protein